MKAAQERIAAEQKDYSGTAPTERSRQAVRSGAMMKTALRASGPKKPCLKQDFYPRRTGKQGG